MNLTKDTKNWTELLPRGTSKRIFELINGVISERSILRILKGEVEDNHGVLIIASKIAKDHQKSKQKLSNDYAIIKLKSSQPLKHK